MSATVLPFRKTGQRFSREKAQSARSSNEIKERAFIKELRESLSFPSGRRKLQRKLRSDKDAILLARRLGKDLERVKHLKRGALSKTLACADLKLTTRARYALFTDDEPSGSRTRKLHPYVRLSDAIADALERDCDLFLYEKLNGINLSEAEQPSDSEAAELCFLLDQMAKAVSEQAGLLEFFDQAARTPGQMDHMGRFLPSSMTILRDRRHEDGFDHWSEQQPIPSVPICRIFEQTIHGRARIAPWLPLDPENLTTLSEAIENGTGCKDVDITIEVWREIGLAVGERFQQGAIGPMFSGQAHIKVKFDEIDATPFYPWTLEHFFTQQPAILVEGHRWTACRAELTPDDGFSDDAWVEPSPPPGETNYAVEHYYFSKHPVNTWNLRRLLDRSTLDSPTAESLLPEISPEGELAAYRFSGEIGRRFEVALAHGEIERALILEINRLKTELHRYLEKRRDTLTEQDELMLARWRVSAPSGVDTSEEEFE